MKNSSPTPSSAFQHPSWELQNISSSSLIQECAKGSCDQRGPPSPPLVISKKQLVVDLPDMCDDTSLAWIFYKYHKHLC